MDQTKLNRTLQKNSAAYNPDVRKEQLAYANLKRRENAGRTPDTNQVQAIKTRRKVK